ncbi:threonine synthase [Luteibacter sp. UNC138MFCol5.1]|uniref:threonine synthase n=1 Tax=Luteibacter sp. UNC138MFCol5.1 TaxID=1502774 RepID=UPI0008D0109B|nr:threonine synthase [Luteibacter sp. UNC138MFCol5.1]SEO40521.1 threonine synthase [Luteibacter sp. UNC138MFCol5.1]
MRYVSTRGVAAPVGLSAAIAAGLAPDGGLYVPEAMPRVSPPADAGYLAGTALHMLEPFFAGDPLADELPAICAEAFAHPAPRRELRIDGAHVLELFHGPTAAFKDFGARFLAACLVRLRRAADGPLTILVATSGDTGAAVGAAFHGLPGFRVAILYPDNRVSPRQAHQLGSFGGNVRALRVEGSFDDCQRLVKGALGDDALQADVPLSSANSISLGRLLPQMAYFGHASLQADGPMNAIVPTGNLGNAVACLWARELGLPIGDVVFACNANETLPDFFGGMPYRPRDAIPTIANAMDVGAPSNFERLRHLFGDESATRMNGAAESVDDAAIRDVIHRHAVADGEVFCPHTATAIRVFERRRMAGDRRAWTIAATAHPAKFESIVEPLVGHPIEVPEALAAMLSRDAEAEPMTADPLIFANWLRSW